MSVPSLISLPAADSNSYALRWKALLVEYSIAYKELALSVAQPLSPGRKAELAAIEARRDRVLQKARNLAEEWAQDDAR
jgi:hypothetical protein